MGPRVQPYLWWKKYLTAFQMLQFIAIMIHAFQLLFIECNYPKAFVWWIGLHAVMFFFLFREFYQQSYQQKRPRKPHGDAVVANGVVNGNDDQSKNKHANGSVNNGIANGAVANGVANSFSSRRRDAADYYVKGESLATELNLRKTFSTNLEWPSSERLSLVDLSLRRRVSSYRGIVEKQISELSSYFLSSIVLFFSLCSVFDLSLLLSFKERRKLPTSINAST